MAGNETGGAGAPIRRNGNLPRLIFAGVMIVMAVGIGGYGFSVHGTESTDDAYTDGRAVTVSPKVSGYVKVLAVNDNSRVKAGQVLVEIDPHDYLVARNKAAASLAIVSAQLETARSNLEIAKIRYPADFNAAKAGVEAAGATLVRARADRERQHRVDVRATTEQQIDLSVEGERAATAQLEEAQAKLVTAGLVPQNIAVAEANVKQLEAQSSQAKADLDQAELNLSYTKIIAPYDGWVTKRNVELGSYLQIGQSLFALVSPEVWITANFKESQLAHMKPGQKAEIKIDAYPDLKLSGHVDSIQMGSGSRFTAFPAENATGNFVKIVQRVPVKIVLDKAANSSGDPLPLGLSAEPVVTVK